MQNEVVTCGKFGERRVYLRGVYLLICAAEENDAVIAFFVYLNYRMTCRHTDFFCQMRVNARALEHIAEHAALCTYISRVENIASRFCHGNRLIKSLAAAECIAGRRRYRFPRHDKMLYAVYIIEVQRTEIEYFHLKSPRMKILFDLYIAEFRNIRLTVGIVAHSPYGAVLVERERMISACGNGDDIMPV